MRHRFRLAATSAIRLLTSAIDFLSLLVLSHFSHFASSLRRRDMNLLANLGRMHDTARETAML